MRLSFVGFASSPFDEFAFVANLSCQERADVIGYICGEDECASKPQHIFANRNTQLAIVMAVDKKKKLPLSSEPFLRLETRLQEDAAHRVPRGQRACKARYRPLFLI